MAFAPDPRTAEVLARLPEVQIDAEIWKHTLPSQPPSAANTRGARWNPPDVPAIYVALTRETALAEGNYLVSMQPQPIRGKRQIHKGRVRILRALDLRNKATLQALQVSETDLRSNNHSVSRRVGGTAEWLGVEAIVVPSARHNGANLVVFERRTGADFDLSFVESEEI